VVTGEAYCPIRFSALRGNFVFVFRLIEAAGDEGLSRIDLGRISAYHLRQTKPGRFVIEVIYWLKRCGLIRVA
jgi:hypothetical protein